MRGVMVDQKIKLAKCVWALRSFVDLHEERKKIKLHSKYNSAAQRSTNANSSVKKPRKTVCFSCIKQGNLKMCGRFFSLQIKTLNERCSVCVCVCPRWRVTVHFCCASPVCRSCLVKYLEENNTCPTCRIVIHQSHPLQYIGWVRNHRKVHTHKRTHTLTHSHFECHQLCSASKQTAEDQRAGGPFPFDFCSSAGNKNPLGVVRLLSFVDLHLAQKHLKPTPIHSSVFCTRV